MKAALLALRDQALRELYKTLVEDTGSVTYRNAKKVLTDHFLCIKNLTAERYKFSVQNLFQIKRVMTVE